MQYQIQRAASPAAGLFRQRAAHQRILAKQTALPNVQRILEGSAEAWEALANGITVSGEDTRVAHSPRAFSEERAVLISIGNLVVDPNAGTAVLAASQVSLTRTECAILRLLAQRKGQTVTKEMLLDHLYDGPARPEVKIIEVFVCKLRKKLSHVCVDDDYIRTVRGRGYMLLDPSPGANTPMNRHDRAPTGPVRRPLG